jgi:SAM-dependent methyltransferase
MSLPPDIDLPPATEVGFWEHYYHEPEIPWDLGAAAPPLVHWLENNPTCFQQHAIVKVVVLGAGAGHDAALFTQPNGLSKNSTVTGLDYAPSAIQMATKRYGKIPNLQFEQADCLNLTNGPLAASLHHTFDLAIEHTFFCAIQPEQRDAYIENLCFVLKPKGYFLGLFWNHGGPGGPPFDTTPEAIQQHFAPHFHLLTLDQATGSHPRRQNKEWLGWFQRR